MPIAISPIVCATCRDNGRIGGPSYYSPDEGGEDCPDCDRNWLARSAWHIRRLTEAANKKMTGDDIAGTLEEAITDAEEFTSHLKRMGIWQPM